MGWQIMGTSHLGVPDVGIARCICATNPRGRDACLLHQVPTMVIGTHQNLPSETIVTACQHIDELQREVDDLGEVQTRNQELWLEAQQLRAEMARSKGRPQ